MTLIATKVTATPVTACDDTSCFSDLQREKPDLSELVSEDQLRPTVSLQSSHSGKS